MSDCQKFEQRIQFLMDSRIDPETDQEICAHSAVCESCYESLMTFSLLHTNYLQDTDSMKIKLEHLGLHEAMLKHKKQRPDYKHLFALAASIAALILVMTALSIQFLNSRPADAVAVIKVEPAPLPPKSPEAPTYNNVDLEYSVSLESFVRIKESLDNNEIYASISELPGLRPFKTISNYLDWFQRSFLGNTPKSTDDKDVGQFDHDDWHNTLGDHLKLAVCH